LNFEVSVCHILPELAQVTNLKLKCGWNLHRSLLQTHPN